MMQTKILQRRYVTLIEMMIVMFLIALIIGVVSYNYQGALDEGKVFKTKTGIQRLETLLNIAAAEDPEILDDIGSQWQEVVRRSPLVQNPDALIRDGWGQLYRVEVDEDGRITVSSESYNRYLESNP